MKIFLDNASKRFIKQRIFHQVNLEFSSPHTYAILGENGSGKSTLLRSIAGMQQLSLGNIHYESSGGKKIAAERVYQYVSYCAPGMELIEEMSVKEMLQFHFQFVPIQANLQIENIIQQIGLQDHVLKHIEELSSGMKQRVKLALSIFTARPVLLLDEPCSNLDEAGIAQYHHWMNTYTKGKLVIIASNDPQEYAFCEQQILMNSLK